MCLTVGSVRSKNVINVCTKNLLDMVVGSIGFYLLGYGFAFGCKVEDGKLEGNGFIGNRFYALNGLPLSERYHWLFNWAFSATANTIVSGAVAERTRFEAYLLFSGFISSWVRFLGSVLLSLRLISDSAPPNVLALVRRIGFANLNPFSISIRGNAGVPGRGALAVVAGWMARGLPGPLGRGASLRIRRH